ncbi:hypothetical protein [Bradyrhizobium liaoningense]
MKSLSLVFYGRDGEAAKARAAQIRKAGGSAQLRHTYAWDGRAEVEADAVIALDCVSAHDRSRLAEVYGDKVAAAGAPVVPPPPGLPDPLANLPADWRNEHGARLKSLAAAVSGGRSVENKDQAIAEIEKALAARGA